jgi:alkyl sulfatase BDS1-like metallo-beta-lactamase superfamily hydrolase
MASVGDCEQALHQLAARLAEADGSTKKHASFDRSLTCRLRDLNVVYAARLRDGALRDIRVVDSTDAQIRMTMTSDDLIALVQGRLHMGSAWASGRVRVSAGVLDLIKLRTIF